MWRGRIFLVCGGAASIDMERRLPRVSWWAEEMITAEELADCLRGGPADVLLTHDVSREADRFEGDVSGDLRLTRSLPQQLLLRAADGHEILLGDGSQHAARRIDRLFLGVGQWTVGTVASTRWELKVSPIVGPVGGGAWAF